MTPQLFLNYRLKSVAHLPLKVLGFRFVNMFIDDLFALIIRMPTMARISCFRDDVVFLVYLWVKVCEIPEDGAAGKTGPLEVVDVLLSIDGEGTTGKGFDETMKMVWRAKDAYSVRLLFQRPAKRKTVEKVGVNGLDSKVEGGKGTAAVIPPRTASAAAGSKETT